MTGEQAGMRLCKHAPALANSQALYWGHQHWPTLKRCIGDKCCSGAWLQSDWWCCPTALGPSPPLQDKRMLLLALCKLSWGKAPLMSVLRPSLIGFWAACVLAA